LSKTLFQINKRIEDFCFKGFLKTKAYKTEHFETAKTLGLKSENGSRT
jgi:hypothetical protein